MSEAFKPHWSFWLIAGLALIWNAMSGFNLMAQTDADAIASMPEAYQAVVNARPAWITGAFGMGILGGVLGSLFMLLRRGQARPFLLLSLIGYVITAVHSWTVTLDSGILIGTGMSIVIGVFLVWYTHKKPAADWLN